VRSFIYFTAGLVLALLVLYGGFNLAERNLADLMGLQRERAAFTVHNQGGGKIKLTFSGNTITVDMIRMLTCWRTIFSSSDSSL